MLTNIIKATIKKIVYRYIPPPPAINKPNYYNVSIEHCSYAQAGEDAVLRFLFNDKKISNIKYLDVGANTPMYVSNTYWFYTNGSTGVCVEADRTLIPEIESVRPNDKVINVGVAVSEQTVADFYIFDIKGLNTFDKEEALRREKMGFKIADVAKVELVNINTIIKNNFATYPDLLSIDIEGLDLEVLKSLDYSQYPIPVICVETCMFSENHVRPKDHSISDFLLKTGYEVYADTYINTIFVNKEWFYKIK